MIARITLTLPALICFGCATQLERPYEVIIHQEAAMTYLANGACELAEQRIRLALEYRPDDPLSHNLLGMIQLSCLKKTDRAIDSFKRAITLDEDFAAAHNNLGSAFLQHLPPRYAEACEEFNAALAIDPGYLDARVNLGSCLARQATFASQDAREKKKLFAESRAQMLRLGELAPNEPEAHFWLGYVDLAEGKTERAIGSLVRCTELEPRHGACQLYLGRAEMALLHCTEARLAFARAAEDEQVGPDARRALAEAHDTCSKQDAALVDVMKKLEGATDPAGHAQLAAIYDSRGLHDDALKEWRAAAALDTNYCEAHYEIAAHADAILDAPATLAACRTFILCARLANQSDPRLPWCQDRLLSLH